MKKLVAILMALAMIFTMSVVAFAEGEEEGNLPKPNEVIDNNVSARNALIAFQNLYREEEPMEYDEEGNPVEGGATMASYPIDSAGAKFFRMCLQAQVTGLSMPSTDGDGTYSSIMSIASKYSKYSEIILKWDKTISESYGYECGFELSWNEAWLNYYGSRVTYLLPSDDPNTEENEMLAAIPDAISFFVGEMGGDMLQGNIDKATASEVYGSIGYVVAELIVDMTETDKVDPVQVMSIVSGAVDIIGKVVPEQVEPADPVTAEDEAQKIINMINDGTSASDIATTVVNDIRSGAITTDMVPDIADIVANSDQLDPEDETTKAVINFLKGLGNGEGGTEFPDFGDITLPWDSEGSESGSFLDTILGILGGLGDIFGREDDPNEGNGDIDNDIPNTGDVSFVAVAAVAAVAGVALVLTRKKEDAE